MKSLQISIVVPALNERDNIPNLLKSLRSQETEYIYEIVIGDNGSTDGTYEYLSKQPDVTVVKIAQKGISQARNGTILASKAPYLAQTDSDSIVPKNWIQEIGDSLINQKHDMVGGLIEWEIKDPTVKAILSSVGTSTMGQAYEKWKEDHSKPMWFTGSNNAFSRKVFNDYGGLDKDAHWGEDIKFSTSVIKKTENIKFIPNITVKTSPRRFGNKISDVLEGVFISAFRRKLLPLGLNKKIQYERKN